MTVRIIDIAEVTKPIASPIRNAYIDFSKMTTSLIAVVTNVARNGKPVVGYGFNSNGRYGQGGLIRERFRVRREIKTKSAHGRMTAGVLMALPPAVAVFLNILAPQNAALLFKDPTGHLLEILTRS